MPFDETNGIRWIRMRARARARASERRFPFFLFVVVVALLSVVDAFASFLVMEVIFTTELADRALAIYSLLLIVIGTPLNLLCMAIYFQRNNRSNSIKLIFGYLALVDTLVLYTFNLNYVIREFRLHWSDSSGRYVKRNLEEYSLIICRFLSYFGETRAKRKRVSPNFAFV